MIPNVKSSSLEPALSVVIPTLGKSPHLRGLLERLQRQETDFPFEVLVVANIPQQSLRKLVNSMGAGTKDHAHFEYLETGRLGVNLARNKGLERARGVVILFLDDDAILETDSFLKAHFDAHLAQPMAAAIGGPYHLAPQRSRWDEAYHEIAHDWLIRHTQSNNRATQLLGGNVSFKKPILSETRETFDDEISFGGSETGLALRLARAGFPLFYFPHLGVGHAPQMNGLTFCRKAFLQGAGARWRQRVVPDLDITFTNEFRPLISTLARRLYQSCFDFGWSLDPYNQAQIASRRNDPPVFPLAAFALFRIRQMKPLRWLRRFQRQIYVTLRTAWINGAIERPTSTLKEMEH